MSRYNSPPDLVFEPSSAGPDTLDQYLAEIQAYPSGLSREQEAAFARAARQGNPDALDDLVNANLRFVITIAKKYQNYGLPLNELIQEGNVGLVRAAKKFDETKGIKFISYAVWWIRQAILQAISEQAHAVRLPLNRRSEISRALRTLNAILDREGRAPTDEELAEEANVTVQIAREARDGGITSLSLDAPVSSHDPTSQTTLKDILVLDPDTTDALSQAETRDLHVRIYEALGELPERDAKILTLYYGLEGLDPGTGSAGAAEHTLEQIGDMLGITRERVRQLRDRGLKNLREKLKPIAT